MIQRFSLRLFCVMAILCVAGLSFAAKPTPTPTPTPAPTAKPSATPTPAPTATPRPSATVTPSATAAATYCPLPVDYGLSSSTSSTSSTTNSPEKGPGPLKALCHKGTGVPKIILCLPPSAYNAHIQHGDIPVAFNCTKEGNQGPCGP